MAGGTNHKFPSSVDKVLSNDDLLMEILLRLPIISLHLFKTVCKQWLSLITSPSFILTRTRIPTVDPPSGLFIRRSSHKYYNYDFVSFDPRIAAKRAIHLCFNSSKTKIVQSCNGLLLCYMEPHGEYCIYNPLIHKFKMLPLIHDLHDEKNGDHQYMMAFDPTKSPYYKVVRAGSVYDDESRPLVRIRTYSSESGIWSVWDDLFHDSSFSGFCHGTYWNGAIYWFSYVERSHVIKLDIVDHPVLTKKQIPLPPNVHGQMYYDRKLFKSRESLLLVCNSGCSRQFHIYEMKNGYSAWLVKYFVNLDHDMMRRYPRCLCCYEMLSIVLGERDEDSFMVIELSGRILQYKFVLETFSELLFDHLIRQVKLCDCFEDIASFAHG